MQPLLATCRVLFSSLCLFLGLNSLAFAHSGDHSHFDTWQLVVHYLTQPFHIGVVIMIVAVTLFAIWKQQRR